MILECPYCSTRFRLDERALGARRPTLRCSKCSRTFTLPPPPEPDDEDDLGLTYDDGPDPAEEEPSTAVERPRDQEQLSFAMERDDDDPQPSLFGDDDDDYAAADDDHYSIDPPSLGDADDGADDEYYFGDTPVTSSGHVKPLLFFLTLVVAGYGMLAWTLRTEPDWARDLMKQVPIIGSEINANRLGREIVLDGLRGRYERTKEGRLVFLVTGSARNEHDEPVRDIRVELQLRDESGTAVAKQSTTCGNAMRADLVRDLTQEQVQILRGWGTRPPEEATVAPGESCPIVGIFIDVPETVTEFSGQVVQARRLS